MGMSYISLSRCEFPQRHNHLLRLERQNSGMATLRSLTTVAKPKSERRAAGNDYTYPVRRARLCITAFPQLESQGKPATA